MYIINYILLRPTQNIQMFRHVQILDTLSSKYVILIAIKCGFWVNICWSPDVDLDK